jgi:hypothetical protein
MLKPELFKGRTTLRKAKRPQHNGGCNVEKRTEYSAWHTEIKYRFPSS